MKRATQLIMAEHSLLCNQSYLDLLRYDVNANEYVTCINTHTELASERLYRKFELKQIPLMEFNEAKSIIIRIHSAYLKKGNINYG